MTGAIKIDFESTKTKANPQGHIFNQSGCVGCISCLWGSVYMGLCLWMCVSSCSPAIRCDAVCQLGNHTLLHGRTVGLHIYSPVASDCQDGGVGRGIQWVQTLRVWRERVGGWEGLKDCQHQEQKWTSILLYCRQYKHIETSSFLALLLSFIIDACFPGRIPWIYSTAYEWSLCDR